MSHKGDHSGFSEISLGVETLAEGKEAREEMIKATTMDSPKYHPSEGHLRETMRHLAAEIIRH